MPLAEVKNVDDGSRQVTLHLRNSQACEDCETLACGLQKRNEVKVPVQKQLNLNAGDTVVIKENNNTIWAAGGLLFVLPLVLFITGTSIGYYGADYLDWPGTEFIGFMGGILLIIGFLPLIRRLGNQLADESNPYTIQAIHTPADDCPNN